MGGRGVGGGRRKRPGARTHALPGERRPAFWCRSLRGRRRSLPPRRQWLWVVWRAAAAAGGGGGRWVEPQTPVVARGGSSVQGPLHPCSTFPVRLAAAESPRLGWVSSILRSYIRQGRPRVSRNRGVDTCVGRRNVGRSTYALCARVLPAIRVNSTWKGFPRARARPLCQFVVVEGGASRTVVQLYGSRPIDQSNGPLARPNDDNCVTRQGRPCPRAGPCSRAHRAQKKTPKENRAPL